MITGIGVDIIEIERIKRAIERTKGKFMEKIYTNEEINYCMKQKNPYQHFAARFAAKEAILKAFGLNWHFGDWKTIEIINSDTGIPQVKLYGKMLEIMGCKEIKKILLTISHFKDYAIAFAICEM